MYTLAGENIKLIITANEISHKRIQFLKNILDYMHADHISIIEGSDLGLDKFTVDDILRTSDFSKDTDFISKIKSVVDNYKEVIYILE